MIADKKKLIIIDSNSVLHRAFHALPPLTTKGGGSGWCRLWIFISII